MIKYRLLCGDCSQDFDSWFASSKEFEKLKKSNHLNCPHCSSFKIKKSLMTPSVINRKKENDDLKSKKHLEVRKKLRKIISLGFQDAYRYKHINKQEYTFWDYMRGAWQKNNGMRIDHFLISNSLIENIKNVNINKSPRGKTKPSDHTPIELELI